MSSEYQIIIPDSGTASEIIDRIDSGKFSEIKKHCGVLDEFFEDYLGYWILEGNIDSFCRYINYDHSKVLLRQSLSETERERVRIQLNRKFLNILSSFRSFVDHADTAVARQGAKNGDIYEKFKKAKSTEFDSNISYRFLWDLRNYAQHCALPISDYGIEIRPTKNRLKFKVNLTPYIVPSHLLESWDRWKPTVKTWLETSKKISLEELIKDLRSSVLRIQSTYIDRNGGLIREAYEFLTEFLATPTLKHKSVALYHIENGKPQEIVSISQYKLVVAFSFVTGRKPTDIHYDED